DFCSDDASDDGGLGLIDVTSKRGYAVHFRWTVRRRGKRLLEWGRSARNQRRFSAYHSESGRRELNLDGSSSDHLGYGWKWERCSNAADGDFIWWLYRRFWRAG